MMQRLASAAAALGVVGTAFLVGRAAALDRPVTLLVGSVVLLAQSVALLAIVISLQRDLS